MNKGSQLVKEMSASAVNAGMDLLILSKNINALFLQTC